MDIFEKNLKNLKVPTIEEKRLENTLWDRLISEFIVKESIFKLRYKVAAVFALLFMVLFSIVLIKPDIAKKINNLAFGKKKDTQLEKILYTLPENQTNYNSIVYKSNGNKNPYINLPEEKRYIIHKYRTNENKQITVISEVPINKKPKVKIIY